ncbi:MAG: tRNA lysidine(34) synthetase TilS [Myxococcota bacterium]
MPRRSARTEATVRLLGQLKRVLERHGLLDAHLLVAASGGVDSTVLLDALAQLAPAHSLRLSVGHVNHQLRGADSEADQAAVAAQAMAHGLPFAARSVDAEALRRGVPSRARPTLQEAARTVRYLALEEMAKAAGATAVATAHQADDQAETLLLRILRGCGPDGLAGIPERSPAGDVTRPLLAVSREEILAYAAARQLCWREDASNRSLRYARNRLRNRWLPGLRREFNPQLLRKLGQLAETMRRDAEWMAELVDAHARRWIRFSEEDGKRVVIQRKGWIELPEALSRRLLRHALLEMDAGRDVAWVHLERMERLMRRGRTGTVIELPGDLRMTCDGEEAVIAPAPGPRAMPRGMLSW